MRHPRSRAAHQRGKVRIEQWQHALQHDQAAQQPEASTAGIAGDRDRSDEWYRAHGDERRRRAVLRCARLCSRRNRSNYGSRMWYNDWGLVKLPYCRVITGSMSVVHDVFVLQDRTLSFFKGIFA